MIDEKEYIDMVQTATFKAMGQTGYVPRSLGGNPNAFTGNEFRVQSLANVLAHLKKEALMDNDYDQMKEIMEEDGYEMKVMDGKLCKLSTVEPEDMDEEEPVVNSRKKKRPKVVDDDCEEKDDEELDALFDLDEEEETIEVPILHEMMTFTQEAVTDILRMSADREIEKMVTVSGVPTPVIVRWDSDRNCYSIRGNKVLTSKKI